MTTKANVISVKFQKQSVQIGSTLYSFEGNRFVQVTGIEEIADEIYIRFEEDGSELCSPLCSSAFSVLPTQEKANEEFDLLQKYKSANKPHEIFKLYQGWTHRQEEANLIAEHTKEGIIRHIAKYTNFALPYFVREVQYGATISKTSVNVAGFVKLYFQEVRNNRENEEARTTEGINVKKAIDFLLTQAYFSEFKIINRLNQHPEGKNFSEWLKSNDLT